MDITIQVTVDGMIKATVNGVEGTACEGISEFLDVLGKVIVDEKTDDYYKNGHQSTETIIGR